MSEKLEFKKVREFGEIISDTIQFIRQNFKSLLKVYAYFCGFFIVAGAIAAVMYQIDSRDVILGAYDKNNPLSAYGFSKLLTLNYLLVFIFSLLMYTSINVSMLSFIALYIQKGNVAPSTEEVWSYFKYYFFRVLLSSILLSMLLVVGFVCCFIPGIYLFPALTLFYPIMVLENMGFTDSFSRSFRLIKDNWWATAGVVLIIYVITYAAMSLASMPAVIITMVGVFTQGAKGLSTTMLVISSVIQYLCYVFLIVPVIGCTLCYFNLAERQESAGLMDRINQLGEQRNDFTTPEEY
ncbi:hypothetical protein D3C87_1350320 [compost metagenome]